MDVKDIRIGDYMTTKSDFNNKVMYRVIELKEGCISLEDINDYNSFIIGINDCDVVAVPVTDEWLSYIGAEYNATAIDYRLSVSDNITLSIRPTTGADNYVASITERYKSPYKYFTYIHELQHWLWDVLQIKF